jgi:hypothetical protein
MNIAEINIPVYFFTNSFKFKTPLLEISANNIDSTTQYYVDIPYWNDTFDISFSKTNVTAGGFYESFPIWADLLAHYADNAFNTPNMYKLFGNKQDIRNSLGDLDISLNIQLRNKLLESGGSISNIKTDSSNNIIYNCLITILSSNAPERITDLFTPERDVTQWLSIPFVAGDTISFNINYTNFTNNFNNNSIPDIEYPFKIHLT